MINLVKEPERVVWQRVGSSLLYVLGTSLFVSIVIVKGVEEARHTAYQKSIHTMNESIKKNVLEATIGTLIPHDKWEIAKRDVLERSLIVRQGLWELIFTEDERRNGWIKLETTMTYSVYSTKQDIVTETRDIKVKPIIEGGFKSLVVKIDGVEKLNVRVKQNQQGQFDVKIDGAKIKLPHKDIHHSVNGDTETLHHKLTLSKLQVAEVITKYDDYYQSPSAVDTIFTHYPTQQLEIFVRFPKGWDFQMGTFSTSTAKLVDSDTTSKKFRFTGGLLPCQGVMYSLRKSQNGKTQTNG